MARFSQPSVTPKHSTSAAAAAPKMQPVVTKPVKVKQPRLSKAKPSTVNVAGGEAYILSLRHRVASLVLNSMLSDRFYTTVDQNLKDLQAIVTEACDRGMGEFVAKAALYARKTHGLRTVSHVLAGELGDQASGATWRKGFYEHIVDRPDDLLEILAYWTKRHPESRHPNAMTRGFAKALAKLDAYRLAKYKGDGKEVSMVDAVNLCHPRVPKDHPIHLLMKGKLAAADTWEKSLSAAGGDEDAKAGEWARLLKDGKLGYLAALRNLRNIAKQAPDAVDMAADLIMDPAKVAKARIFPFQFRTAYDILRQDTDIPAKVRGLLVGAVAKAADLALANVPKLDGATLVVVDDSGSMTSGGNDSGTPIKIASVFAAALMKGLPDADYMQFSDDARYMNLDTVGMGVFALANAIEGSCKSGGTNFESIFTKANANRKYRRVIILSDMQGWMGHGAGQGSFKSYCGRAGIVPFIYSFDLTGNGTSQFPQSQVALLSGFSEKIFDIMNQVEVDKDAMIHAIDAVKLS